MQSPSPSHPRQWFAGGLIDALSPADRRALLLLVGLVAVSLVLRILTWDVVADGPRARFVKTAILGAAAASTVWALIRVQTKAASRVPLVCAVIVLVSGDVVHYLRLANPITRGGPIVALETSFGDEAEARRSWDFETSGSGRISAESGALRLESGPGASAYVIARLAAPPDVLQRWWLPVGLIDRERDERIAWRAAVQRTGSFYAVIELRRLLVQVVSYGLHVTYPDENNNQRGSEITHPVGSDGQPHDWRLTRGRGEVSLELDGRQVWKAPAREAFNQLRLGDSKSDPAHGGSMRLERASYASTLVRE
jgi:hypothetical protein